MDELSYKHADFKWDDHVLNELASFMLVLIIGLGPTYDVMGTFLLNNLL